MLEAVSGLHTIQLGTASPSVKDKSARLSESTLSRYRTHGVCHTGIETIQDAWVKQVAFIILLDHPFTLG